jgi:Flp pilus assembly protein TadD
MPDPRASRSFAIGFLLAGVAIALGGCASTGGYGLDARAVAQHEAEAAAASAERKPDNQATYLTLIRQMQQKDLYFASLAHIDAYVKQYGNDPDVELLRANALRETGQDAAAANLYREVAQSSTPVAAAAWYGLGLIKGHAGDYAVAVADFQEAVRRDPTKVDYLNDLGYASLQLGDDAGARVAIAKAAELAPQNPKVVANLAVYLLTRGENARAEELMVKANLSASARTAARQLAFRIRASRVSGAAASAVSAAAAEPAPVVASRLPATQGRNRAATRNHRADPDVSRTPDLMQPMLDRFGHRSDGGG